MLLVLATCFAAHAQQPASPYAGYEQRPIKALSDQQVADLRAGRGMGLALAAELNGYPGPVHVLELAAPLELTPEQRARTQALFEAMKAETVPLGERLIAREAELDRLFATRAVDETALGAAVAAIGETQAALRTAHLRFHLRTIEVLTPLQMQRYSHLRGYGGSQGPQHNAPMHH
jgi:Spy/CpxP family protein refolding chaperone